MIDIIFLKVEASGNDFILIDNLYKKYNIDYCNFAVIACNRHKGIGADGLLILEPTEIADFKMRYLNSDGSEGGMCGNGGRAIAMYASHLLGKENLSFEALNHIYTTEVKQNRVSIRMKDPIGLKQNKIVYKDQELPIWFIDTGAPHTVIFWENISSEKSFSEFDIIEFGRNIRFHELYKPDGTNVNLVYLLGNNGIKIRTYERGVENETLSCGTGSIASAIISTLKFNLSPPIKVIPLSNDELVVDFSYDKGKISNVTLEGSVNIVFRGELIYNENEKKIIFKL